MNTKSKNKISALELVCPPVSNQEAVWLKDDPQFIFQAKQSDFYVIAGRAEAKFANVKFSECTNELHLDFIIGDNFSDSVQIDFNELETVSEMDVIWITAQTKVVRFWNGDPNIEASRVVDLFTTESLLYERSRDRKGINGFERYRQASSYDLLYVGIAKVGDSYSRLIENGHKARLEILANEPQRYPGSRVTDETYLFLFSINSLDINIFRADHVFQEDEFMGATSTVDKKRVVADAEKAFVNLLKPSYNVIRFNEYPKGTDGLYDAGYDRYGYVVGENFTFNTPHGQIVGGYSSISGFLSNEGNMILVDRKKHELIIT